MVAVIAVVSVVTMIAVVAVLVAVVSMIAAVIFVAAAHGTAVKLMAMIVAVEVIIMIAATRILSMVSVAGIISIIDVTMPTMGSVEPRACTNEEAVREPLRTVVAVGSAIVRGVVEIAVRTDRLRSHIHTEAERNLSFCGGRSEESESSNDRNNCKIFNDSHLFTSLMRTENDKNSCANCRVFDPSNRVANSEIKIVWNKLCGFRGDQDRISGWKESRQRTIAANT